MDFIGAIEKALGKTAEKIFLPMQDGDVPATYADTQALEAAIRFTPKTKVEIGVSRFVSWYKEFYGNS
jgi:UDP-glucuronate 4-epimerase